MSVRAVFLLGAGTSGEDLEQVLINESTGKGRKLEA
jgi:hypothetical protein